MRRIVLVLLTSLVWGAGAFPTVALAAPAQVKGSVQLNWKVIPLITGTVTPNYQTGFGPQGGNGSGSTPVVGPSARLNGGFVDFGTVVQGFSYIYKFAAQVSVTTNDNSGFTLYGEGSSNLNGAATGPVPISSVLFWLPNNAANTAFSPATPFQATTNAVTNGGLNITYAGAPPPSALISSTSTAGNNVSLGYDYELRLPSSIPVDKFTVFVVYTVIGN